MKTINYTNRVKLATRLMWQWRFLGVSLGFCAAILFSPSYQWLAAKQVAAQIPDSQVNSNQIDQLKWSATAQINDRANSLLKEYTIRHPADLAAQLVCSRINLDKQIQASTASKRLEEDRQAAINKVNAEYESSQNQVLSQNAGNALAIAGYLNYAEVYYVSNRTDQMWLNGTYLDASLDTSYTSAAKRQNKNPLIRKLALKGVQVEPRNAYFWLALAATDYSEKHDDLAERDIQMALNADHWEDYRRQIGEGAERMHDATAGRNLALVDYRMEYRWSNYSSIRMTTAVFTAMIWKATQLEHTGHMKDGLRLRLAVAKLASAYLSDDSNFGQFGSYPRIMDLLVKGSSKTFAPISNVDQSTEYISEQRMALLKNLYANGFSREAATLKSAFGAIAAAATLSTLSNDSTVPTSVAINERRLKILGISGYWFLSQIIFATLIGTVAGMLGYVKRFRKEKVINWTGIHWFSATGGVVLSFLVLIGIIELGQTQLLPVFICLGCGFLLVSKQVIGRSAFYNSPVTVLFNTVGTSNLLLAAMYVSCIGISSLSAVPFVNVQPSDVTPSSLHLMFLLACGAGLLPLIVVTLFTIFAFSRSQYHTLPNNLTKCLRNLVVPIITILLLTWGVSVIMTTGLDNYVKTAALTVN